MRCRIVASGVVGRTCTPPGSRDTGDSERRSTGVGTARVIHGMSWDGPRPSQSHGTQGGSVNMKATDEDALNLIRHWKDEQAPLRCYLHQ